MKESRFTEEQIRQAEAEAEAGMPVEELCRKAAGFSDATFDKWRLHVGLPDASHLVSQHVVSLGALGPQLRASLRCACSQ